MIPVGDKKDAAGLRGPLRVAGDVMSKESE
jgi:hypothetical protein